MVKFILLPYDPVGANRVIVRGVGVLIVQPLKLRGPMENSSAALPTAYRQTTTALILAALGVLLVLFGLTAPSYCVEDGDCKFFDNALFDHNRFDDRWQAGVVGNYNAFRIVGVLPAILVAVRLRRRPAMLIGALAVLLTVGLIYETYDYLVSELEFYGAQLRWGWLVIWAGVALIGIAVSMKSDPYPIDPLTAKAYRWPNNTQVTLTVVGLVLYAVGGITPLVCYENADCEINGAGAMFDSEQFDEGFTEGVVSNSSGLATFGLALLCLVAVILPGTSNESRNSALVVATVAAAGNLLVLFMTLYAAVDVNERARFAWGWIPFWLGMLLLAEAARREAVPEPMMPLVATETPTMGKPMA